MARLPRRAEPSLLARGDKSAKPSRRARFDATPITSKRRDRVRFASGSARVADRTGTAVPSHARSLQVARQQDEFIEKRHRCVTRLGCLDDATVVQVPIRTSAETVPGVQEWGGIEQAVLPAPQLEVQVTPHGAGVSSVADVADLLAGADSVTALDERRVA